MTNKNGATPPYLLFLSHLPSIHPANFPTGAKLDDRGTLLHGLVFVARHLPAHSINFLHRRHRGVFLLATATALVGALIPHRDSRTPLTG